VPSMSSGKLLDQANAGAARHKPPVSCQLPRFAEGKVVLLAIPGGAFFRLNTDPNQSAAKLHPPHTEQPLEKSPSGRGVI